MTYKEHYINKEDNFIGGWYISPDLCDALLEKTKKKIAYFSYPYFDYYVANYLDQLDADLYQAYINELKNVTKLYVKKYHFISEMCNFRLCEHHDSDPTKPKIPTIKFQKYYPNRSYHKWHCENEGRSPLVLKNRHLATMTYVNDVHDDGGTEFFYQRFTCKPEKGLTLIWPAHWTHMHRGQPSATEYKYILTGWHIFDETLTNNEFVDPI